MTGIDNVHLALVFIFIFQHHVLDGIVAFIHILYPRTKKFEATILDHESYWQIKCIACETAMKLCSSNCTPAVLDLEETMVKII